MAIGKREKEDSLFFFFFKMRKCVKRKKKKERERLKHESEKFLPKKNVSRAPGWPN